MSRVQLTRLIIALVIPVGLVLGQDALLEGLYGGVEWLRERGTSGAFLFAGGYFVAGMVALPMFPLSVLAGVVYGFQVGALVLCPAAVLAAALAGWLGGAWFREPVLRAVARRPAWRAVFTELADKGIRAVVLNRMAPVLPFGLQNYALGAIGVNWRALAVGTLVGMQPAIWVALYLGVVVADLAEAKAAIADGGGGLRLYLSVAGLAALGVLVVWLGRVARRARSGSS